ncbi:MAG: response regulator [Lachnospiraceae bacterium]|nr:response regulator [Lachnospiraceae bacterium]
MEETVGTVDGSLYRVLVLEANSQRKDLFVKLLQKMSVFVYAASDEEEFMREAVTKRYTHMFLANEIYEPSAELFQSVLDAKELLVVGENNSFFHDEFLRGRMIRPVTCLSMKKILTAASQTVTMMDASEKELPFPKASVMVVDDNHINLNIMAHILRNYCGSILTAANGKECLRILGKESVDLIFMDYMMPELDGCDTLHEIRRLKDPDKNSIPVIVLTANAVSGAREMFTEEGFSDYLSKPVEIQKVFNVLQQYLSKDVFVVN